MVDEDKSGNNRYTGLIIAAFIILAVLLSACFAPFKYNSIVTDTGEGYVVVQGMNGILTMVSISADECYAVGDTVKLTYIGGQVQDIEPTGF